MRKKEIFVLIGLWCVSMYGGSDYSIILKKNIFTEPPPKPKPVIEKTPIVKPVVPSLNTLIDLVGIFYSAEGDSYVVLNVKGKGGESIFKEGDVVENATIVKIEPNSVVFLYDGKEERFSLKEEHGEGTMVSVLPGVSVKIEEKDEKEKKSMTESQIINPSSPTFPEFTTPVFVDLKTAINEVKNDKELLKKLNVTPKLNGGKVDGFEISNLPPNSLPYKYGLRDGDIVRRVNGIFIDSISKGFAVYNQIIREGTEIVTVEVLRNNNPLVLTFKIK